MNKSINNGAVTILIKIKINHKTQKIKISKKERYGYISYIHLYTKFNLNLTHSFGLHRCVQTQTWAD